MTDSQPTPANEAERLRGLRTLGVLDSEAEPIFDALAQAAALVCGVPIALLSLVDSERQWFKANVGLEGVEETPREVAFCAHTIMDSEVMVVEDASLDSRFADNPLVTDDPSIRFYAGAPVSLPGDLRIGTLCAIDRQPHTLDAQQRAVLQHLANAAARALMLRQHSHDRLAAALKTQQMLGWLYQSTPAMLFSIDAQGYLIRVSDTWLQRLGYERSEVIGRRLMDFVSPDSMPYIRDVVRPAFIGAGRIDNVAGQMVCKDGRIIDAAFSAVLERDAQQRVVSALGVIEDVTAEQRAERRLRKSRDRIQSVLAGTGAGTWEWNVQTNETRFNERWAEMIGYSLVELEPVSLETWTKFAHPDDLAESFELIEQHLRGETAYYEHEGRMRHKDGHWVWVSDSGQIAEWDADGNALWMMGTHTDITARKVAELALRENQRLLERTGEIAEVGGWAYDLITERLHWSDQAYRIQDVEPGSAITVNMGLNLYPDAARHEVEQAFADAIANGTPWDIEVPMVTRAGRSIWVHVAGAPEIENGQVVRLVGVIQDITRRHVAERKLAENRELLQVTLESIGDAVITTDLEGGVKWLNPVAERLTGWTFEQARGQPLARVFSIVHEASREPAADPVARCLAEGKLEALAENTVLIARDGNEYGIKDSAAPIRDRDGDALGVVLIFHDVSEQRRLNQEMGYRATHDALTGLANRSEFETRLSRVLQQAHERSTTNALMYIDLDQFKIVNDSCGHAVGDQLLQQISGILDHCVRKRDTLARLGGDEFGVILEHCSVAQAKRVAQAICDEVNEYRFVHEDKPYRVGTSIGLVPIDGNSPNEASVLQAADSACYAAKEAGRNRVHIWREKDQAIRARHGQMQWAGRIEQALDQDRFVLYGQRIVPLSAEAKGLHCEVLLRIRADDDSLVLPGAFLPAAERYHLASRIDRWVVRNTFAALAAIGTDSGVIDTVSINLSGHSIGDQVFHGFLTDMIKAARFDVGKLCLEITETAAITHIGDARRFIGEMRKLGIRIALDDFGAGASSFGYLKSLPVNYLKIDGQFIRELIADPLDLAAVRCFIEVAAVVGIETVAEFVEREDVLAKLNELGVDFAQGYLLHRPQPLAELFKLAATASMPTISGIRHVA